jgi:hypothetical protein
MRHTCCDTTSVYTASSKDWSPHSTVWLELATQGSLDLILTFTGAMLNFQNADTLSIQILLCMNINSKRFNLHMCKQQLFIKKKKKKCPATNFENNEIHVPVISLSYNFCYVISKP